MCRVGLVFGPAGEAATGGNVCLASEDWLDAFIARCLVEIDGSVQNAVIGNGNGRHAGMRNFFHEAIDPACPIQDAEMCVQMQMNKRIVTHADIVSCHLRE